MKKLFSVLFIALFVFSNAQDKDSKETANRFFYELTYSPNKDSLDKRNKEMMILDITKDKSIYRDYLAVSQDSILKLEVEAMQKAGTYKDLSKSIKQPKFSHVITKSYPSMDVSYADYILQDKVSYKDEKSFDWKISADKAKIGEYNTQKATTTFGGRSWIAWFTTDIPFQDGPYKFKGLPGLIVKVEDDTKNYSWELKGNKKITNYDPESYSEKLMKQFGQGKNSLEVSREKFEKMYAAYKKDPFGSIRTQLSQIPADAKMPDGTPMSQMMKEAEERMKKYLSENNNSIELIPVKEIEKKK
ncbi:GLPGLI family protein [Chryseobacterium daecheongense]|uniref:GLPGLI family protein n=1 Tax=Chryseobacterium daecheongense TaxID=192389 RepID=UPI001FD6AC7B|nr:GLPGLI family protein [Chryseobacterium daecheongense]UOU99380.1 GLPGLI family protein [Chryseobacterium daecheongense]